MAALDIKRAKELQYEEGKEKEEEEDNKSYGKLKGDNNENHLSNQTGNATDTSSTHMTKNLASRNEFEKSRRYALENTDWGMFERQVYLGSDKEVSDDTCNFMGKYKEGFEGTEAEGRIVQAERDGSQESSLKRMKNGKKKHCNDVETDEKIISSETFNFDAMPYYAGRKRKESSTISTKECGDVRKKIKNNIEKNKKSEYFLKWTEKKEKTINIKIP